MSRAKAITLEEFYRTGGGPGQPDPKVTKVGLWLREKAGMLIEQQRKRNEERQKDDARLVPLVLACDKKLSLKFKQISQPDLTGTLAATETILALTFCPGGYTLD